MGSNVIARDRAKRYSIIRYTLSFGYIDGYKTCNLISDHISYTRDYISKYSQTYMTRPTQAHYIVLYIGFNQK